MNQLLSKKIEQFLPKYVYVEKYNNNTNTMVLYGGTKWLLILQILQNKKR